MTAAFPAAGIYLILFGLPVVVAGVGLAMYRGGEKEVVAPVVREVDDYDKAKRLRAEAEPHITRLFQAKRSGDKALVRQEFKQAEKRLLEARELLEGLKARHTDDKTLDGDLSEGYAYLDHDLQKLQEDFLQIIREVEY